jgi:hypothetical protein
MPDRTKVRGQTKWNPWASMFGVGCGAETPSQKINCYETSRAYGGGLLRRRRPTQGCGVSTEGEEWCYIFSEGLRTYYLFLAYKTDIFIKLLQLVLTCLWFVKWDMMPVEPCL